MRQIRVPGLTCLRCGHTWVPRRQVIKICPRCKSKLWDVPKKNPAAVTDM